MRCGLETRCRAQTKEGMLNPIYELPGASALPAMTVDELREMHTLLRCSKKWMYTGVQMLSFLPSDAAHHAATMLDWHRELHKYLNDLQSLVAEELRHRTSSGVGYGPFKVTLPDTGFHLN